MTVLIIAEHDNSELKSSTLNTVTAGKLIDDNVEILVAGYNCSSVAEKASAVSGVRKVLLVDLECLKDFLPENFCPLIKEVSSDYSHILAPATTFGKNILPRASALMDVQQVSDISGVIDESTFIRPIYAGNALATVRSSDSVKLISIRTTAFESAGESEAVKIEHIDSQISDSGLSTFIGEELTSSERPELTTADIIVSGGRGMQSSDNFAMLEKLADNLGAAVGASRAAVDAGYVPNDYQVGQTGKVVAPSVYFAIGISGAIQHLAGMKDSKVIVAINKDEEAPIFQVADYGWVTDLFEAVPLLDSALEASKT